jgi:DNA-binding NarL/FixJ family response regulator
MIPSRRVTTLLDGLKQHHKNTKVLAVTASMSNAATVRMMEAGAPGIFLKHSSLDQLLSCDSPRRAR